MGEENEIGGNTLNETTTRAKLDNKNRCQKGAWNKKYHDSEELEDMRVSLEN